MPVSEECGIFRTWTQRRVVRLDRSQMRLRSFCSVTTCISRTRVGTECQPENWQPAERGKRTLSLIRATRAWVVLAELPGAPNSPCAARVETANQRHATEGNVSREGHRRAPFRRPVGLRNR